MTDLELLEEYSRSRSDRAFADLVERYIRLVHSACWRQLHDAQLAEDATQQVFVLLSRKAPSLGHANLSGWLLTTAHYVGANMKRSEMRRARREQVVALKPINSPDEPKTELLQMLDAGLLRLRADDRQALVLRFLREQPLRQVGEALGLSEDAARKRVDRGLDKLRRFFEDRGIQTDSAALAVALADHSHDPPIAAGLARRIMTAARIRPVSYWAALRPEALISATVLMSALLGAVGWEIFRESSQRSVADPVVAAPPAAPAPDVAANDAPVNQTPALDRSTPDNTLASLCQAWQNADRAGVYSCLLSDPNRPRRVIDASIDGGLAERRMMLAAQKAYGPDAAKLLNGVPFATVLQAQVVMRRMEGDTADISGNSAIIRTQIPAAIVQNAPADAQQFLLEWSGKPIYFQLRDGAWRIDMDRSIRFVMTLMKQGSSSVIQPSDALTIDIIDEQARQNDSIAQRIGSGQLPRLSDALRARGDQWGELSSKFGLSQLSTHAAPALGDRR